LESVGWTISSVENLCEAILHFWGLQTVANHLEHQTPGSKKSFPYVQ
jgi:hypothetical protein